MDKDLKVKLTLPNNSAQKKLEVWEVPIGTHERRKAGKQPKQNTESVDMSENWNIPKVPMFKPNENYEVMKCNLRQPNETNYCIDMEEKNIGRLHCSINE